MAKTTVSTEAHSGAHPSGSQQGFISPDVAMLILTWVTFFLLLGVLYKFAWKPILSALDAREEKIRKSVEDAENLQQQLEEIQQTQTEILEKANQESKDIVNKARKAAQEAAKHIEQKAREEGQIILENARREIKDEIEKAQADLREESARIAVELAGKILEENLNTEKNKKLINRITKEL